MIENAGIFPEAKQYSDELETLLLEARRLNRSLKMGEHGRRTAGAGSDFWQFRKFENGLDSPRLISWKQSAKSDGLFVRETEWSAPQTLSIVVDRTVDNFIDHPKSKAYLNALIALTLGYAYSDVSEKVRIDCGEFLHMERPGIMWKLLMHYYGQLSLIGDCQRRTTFHKIPRRCFSLAFSMI